jgi:hypothetical protein
MEKHGLGLDILFYGGFRTVSRKNNVALAPFMMGFSCVEIREPPSPPVMIIALRYEGNSDPPVTECGVRGMIAGLLTEPRDQSTTLKLQIAARFFGKSLFEV